MTSTQLIRVAAAALSDKKAVDIKAVEIGDLTILAEYFLFASGTSSTHVKTLAEEVEYKLSEQGVEPHHIEGRATGWILLDYGTLVVHVFSREAREFYSLERLWGDGKPVELETLLGEPQDEGSK